jgi:NTP pyrophosphatase (non-canonical NTP hydrolase)
MERTQIFSEEAETINDVVQAIHNANLRAGWWTSIDGEDLRHTSDNTGPKRNVPEMLALIHSEISEGLEGYRKNLMDDKLPHRSMLEVEMADAVIRICDLCGGLGLDLGGAIQEKMAYNAVREDHKLENRKQAGGKSI